MPSTNPDWIPYREPLRTTLTRTVTIAVVVAIALVALSGRGLRALPLAILLALWPTLGGHFVELFFLNWLRPRLPAARGAQVVARVVVWFVGGCLLAVAMYLTTRVLFGFRPPHWQTWPIAGVAFIGIELIAHLVLQLRGCNSFYNGRG
jgi:hypothetical protein